MNRRKFLSVGGIGLLGVNGLVYGISPGLFKNEVSLAEQFVYWLGGHSAMNEDSEIIHHTLQENVRDLLASGYQFKENSFFHTDSFYLCCLEIKKENIILDEIVVVYNKTGDCIKTGTLDARQINWFLTNAEKIDTLAEAENGSTEEWILPTSPKRVQHEGVTQYVTRKGAIGFSTYIATGKTTIHGIVYGVPDTILLEDMISSKTFYPKTDYI